MSIFWIVYLVTVFFSILLYSSLTYQDWKKGFDVEIGQTCILIAITLCPIVNFGHMLFTVGFLAKDGTYILFKGKKK